MIEAAQAYIWAKLGGRILKVGILNYHGVPEVKSARCTGCGRCVAACPERLFSLEVFGFRKLSVLAAPERCSRCLKCRAACPVGALGRQEPESESP
jgi:ferredoxin